jgi:hypothetical protein
MRRKLAIAGVSARDTPSHSRILLIRQRVHDGEVVLPR